MIGKSKWHPNLANRSWLLNGSGKRMEYLLLLMIDLFSSECDKNFITQENSPNDFTA